ncbi:E3 ubiquitin-protein ligase bre1 [Cryptotrichosporon argae]
MNAELKRVRDLSGDDGPSSSKRRALGLSSPPSVAADAPEPQEDWMAAVEARQKEAIYRQMLEYRRLHGHEAARAERVEKQRRTLEASLRSVEVCWAQVVAAIRDAGGRVDDAQNGASQPMLDPQIPPDDFEKALQPRLVSTQHLVSSFFDLAAKSELRPAGNDELQRHAQRAQTEAGAANAKAALAQTQVAQIAEERDTALRELRQAEKKLDRQRMEFDKEREEWRVLRDMPAQLGKAANGSGRSTPNGKVDEDVKPKAEVQGASDVLQNTAELGQLAASRLHQLQKLRADYTALTQELDQLRLLAKTPSEATLRESPFFQVYLHQLATLSARAETFQQRFEAAEKNLDALKENNLAFHDAVMAETRADVDSLRGLIAKRDADLVRLRGQRDEMNAELHERRSREAEKTRFADEVDGLAKARAERIVFLETEIRRLKGKLAADGGAQGYLAFLKEAGVDGDYVKDLEAKLTASQDKVAALERQLQSTPDRDAQTAQGIELAEARRTLADYRRVLGPDAATDVKVLADKLQESEKERSSMELKLSEAEVSTNALYAEVEGLSKLWEGLETTLRTKVFQLKDGEQKMVRLREEKAKADNKYFAAMRTKEALDAECKTAQRTIEKQSKVLERAQEVERGLTAEIAQQEKVVTSLKNALLDLQTQSASLSSDRSQLEARLQQSQIALADAQQVMRQRVAESNADREARVKAQEEAEAAQRAVKKLRERQEATAGSGVSASEAATKEERDKLWKLLRCSCCEQNFKQQVIIKCMHTFCKGCLDSRIASRQRKCPACGLAFAKEDCQTLYWQ